MAVPFSDLQQIAPSAVIELFQLELNTTQHGVNETYYFHAGTNLNSNGDIVWNGQSYLRFPIEATDFEYSGTGQLPRPKLRVSNIFGTITALILTLPYGIEGAKVTRIRTLARYLDSVNFPPSDLLLLEDDGIMLLESGSYGIGLEGDNPTADPTAEFPREIYFIDRKSAENRDVIEFELASAFDLVGVRAPKRQCVSNICQWKYRGPECGYIGNAYFNANDEPVGTLAADACGKRLRSCELRFSQQRFFGSVTTGSNVLTLTAPASLSTGDPVTGFGLPAGTTVSSVSGNLVTVSQNAFASTAATTTGTIQGNYTQIVVASATGIVPGMAVTGSYLPANCQVVAVSGTTITLSSLVDPLPFLTVISTFSAQVAGNRISVTAALGTAGSIGQLIAGPQMPLSRLARIVNVRNIYRIVGKNVIQSTVFDMNQAAVFPRFIINLFRPPFANMSASFSWSIYQENAIPSATYTFFATNTAYTFRGDATLPYGSYPGIGTYAA